MIFTKADRERLERIDKNLLNLSGGGIHFKFDAESNKALNTILQGLDKLLTLYDAITGEIVVINQRLGTIESRITEISFRTGLEWIPVNPSAVRKGIKQQKAKKRANGSGQKDGGKR